tara:strand:+ start:95 stop:514 length:420 start_codon:yes stop_codon:yes gene_type:complete
MTNIDFYILSETERQARLNFACRLIDKTYRLGNRIFVACTNEVEMTELDNLLWSFNPESFIPHSLLNSKQNEIVEIGSIDDCGDHHQLLINLSNKLPEYFSRFERVCEIVIQEDAILKRTRENWTFLKQRGYHVASHNL